MAAVVSTNAAIEAEVELLLASLGVDPATATATQKEEEEGQQQLVRISRRRRQQAGGSVRFGGKENDCCVCVCVT